MCWPSSSFSRWSLRSCTRCRSTSSSGRRGGARRPSTRTRRTARPGCGRRPERRGGGRGGRGGAGGGGGGGGGSCAAVDGHAAGLVPRLGARHDRVLRAGRGAEPRVGVGG